MDWKKCARPLGVAARYSRPEQRSAGPAARFTAPAIPANYWTEHGVRSSFVISEKESI